MHPLLCLFVSPMLATAAAELIEFEPFGRCLLVFRGDVVAAFAFGALQHNIIAWHNFLSVFSNQ